MILGLVKDIDSIVEKDPLPHGLHHASGYAIHGAQLDVYFHKILKMLLSVHVYDECDVEPWQE